MTCALGLYHYQWVPDPPQGVDTPPFTSTLTAGWNLRTGRTSHASSFLPIITLPPVLPPISQGTGLMDKERQLIDSATSRRTNQPSTRQHDGRKPAGTQRIRAQNGFFLDFLFRYFFFNAVNAVNAVASSRISRQTSKRCFFVFAVEHIVFAAYSVYYESRVPS